ncbi:EAL domain-containing protein [Vibrio lentus]|nr:EAL domain-containing protein [Vibrio lentus]
MLLRWESPQLGSVPLMSLFQFARQTGLFDLVDRWVIQHAFASFHKLQAQFDHTFDSTLN